MLQAALQQAMGEGGFGGLAHLAHVALPSDAQPMQFQPGQQLPVAVKTEPQEDVSPGPAEAVVRSLLAWAAVASPPFVALW